TTPGRCRSCSVASVAGLIAATLVSFSESRLPSPCAGICISPWTDLTCSAASYQSKAAVDPMVNLADIMAMAHDYLGATDPRTPLASPLFADLRGLPPLLIQAGREEALLAAASRRAARARA